MIKFSNTQLVVLSAACQRTDRNLLLLPANLKGGATQKVVAGLLAKGLVEEGPANPGGPVWRTGNDGRRVTLLATDAAIQVLGIEAEPTPTAEAGSAAETAPALRLPRQTGRKPQKGAARGGKAKIAAKRRKPRQSTPTRAPRADTKQARLIAMLKQPDGASLDEIVSATGWQAHTVRGAFVGALKKKLGLTISSEKVEGRGRVYRIAD